jgi:AAA+ superfamily predicted ATPase
MKLEDFISDALSAPYYHISYYISRRLAELYPEKAIVEGSAYSFNLDGYARAGQCSIIGEESVHNQFTTAWRGIGSELSRDAENGWFNVLWEDNLLDVVLVTWEEGRCKSRQHWILADTREVAEGFFRSVCHWSGEVRSEILVFDNGRFSKSEELFRAIRGASFDNLIMPPGLKQEIQQDFTRFFASREMYERYAIPWKRGVLFIGPPGNGKTHLVKALINYLARPCLYVKSFKSFFETDDENIREVFARARQTTPCLVVLEDLDSLVKPKSRSFFLNEMDGFAANTGVLVLATTNHPKKLDPAILDRPSRFDRKYHFGLPATADRRRYIEAWNGPLQPDMQLSEADLGKAVELTEGFSFAYLKELFLSAMMQWVGLMEAGGMGQVLLSRIAVLREEMASAAQKAAASEDDD